MTRPEANEVQRVSRGLVAQETLLVSGEIVALELQVHPSSEAKRNAVRTSLGACASEEQSGVQKRVKSALRGFGRGWVISPLAVNNDALVVRATISAGYARARGPEWIAERTAKILASVRNSLEERLRRSAGDSSLVVTSRSCLAESVLDPSGVSELARDDQLASYLSLLESRRRQRLQARQGSVLLALVGVAGLVLSPLLLLIIPDASGLAVLGGGYALLLLAFGLGGMALANSQLREIRNDLDTTADALDLRRIQAAEADSPAQVEGRAQRLLQVHGAELRRYYGQALGQAKSVYYVGLSCIAVGVGVIGASFALVAALDGPTSNETAQLIIGVLGAIGAVLANFIAIIYLRMFSETVRTLTGFHERLVATHRLHFANFLLSKVRDESVRYGAIAKMGENLSVVGGEGNTSGSSPPETDDTRARSKQVERRGWTRRVTAFGKTRPPDARQP